MRKAFSRVLDMVQGLGKSEEAWWCGGGGGGGVRLLYSNTCSWEEQILQAVLSVLSLDLTV